ncbi:MAG: lamin tail domain-containing protein [Bacteroidota bacterium]
MPKNIPAVMLLVLQMALEPTRAQVLETFADTNITNRPTWFGDTARFRVQLPGPYLQLQAPAVSGQAWLGTPSRAVHQGSWEIRFELRFNPSSSNQMDWYLMATDSFPHQSGQSYLLRIGGSEDNLTFFRKTGSSLLRIGSLASGWLNRDLNPMAIRVERYLNGLWYFWADSSQTSLTAPRWQWLGDFRDSTLTNSRFTGWHGQYTATRSTLFSWYLLKVQGQPIPDTISPSILSWRIEPPTKINLLWKESMDTGSLSTSTLTWVEEGRSVDWRQWYGDTLLQLDFGRAFPLDVDQTLRIRGLQDIAGNRCDTDLNLYHTRLEHGRLVFTEIMSDPDPPLRPPPLGLPTEEYVEIYNPGPTPLELDGYRFSDLNTTALLPKYLMAPHAIVVLVPKNALPLWQAWVKLHDPEQSTVWLGLDPWPSLNNEGDRLSLQSATGVVLDTLRYSLPFWKTLPQKQGGWSLTKFNALCRCADSLQWQPSTHDLGGDPGLLTSNVDTGCRSAGLPALVDAPMDGMGRLYLRFGTAVHPNEETRVALVIHGDTVELFDASYPRNVSQTVWPIAIPEHLQTQPGEAGWVLCQGWLTCHGDTLPRQQKATGLAALAQICDLLITEVYPRPIRETWPWVELCNRSNRVLDASRVWIARTDLEGQVLDANPVGQWLDALVPNQCYILSRGSQMLLNEGLQPCKESEPMERSLRFDLPALPITGGFVELQDPWGQRLDRIAYHDSSFHPLAPYRTGLSLERLPNAAPETRSGHPLTSWWTSTPQNRAGPGCFPNRGPSTIAPWTSSSPRRRHSLYRLRVSANNLTPSLDGRIQIGLDGPSTALVNLDITDWTGKTLYTLSQQTLADSLSTWYWDGSQNVEIQKAPWQGYTNGHRILRLIWQDAEGKHGWDLLEIYVRSP